MRHGASRPFVAFLLGKGTASTTPPVFLAPSVRAVARFLSAVGGRTALALTPAVPLRVAAAFGVTIGGTTELTVRVPGQQNLEWPTAGFLTWPGDVAIQWGGLTR